jgi:hypothetical protein
MGTNSFKKESMSSGDPKKRPGGGSGNGSSRDPSASTPRSVGAPRAADPAGSIDVPLNTFAPKKQSGRVQFDDRGNAIWEWAVSTGAFGREVSTERLKKLENPGLSLADDAPTPFDKVKPNPQGVVKGYNPYDSGKLGRAGAPPPKKKDLRKLSDWLKLKKQAGNKASDDDE